MEFLLLGSNYFQSSLLKLGHRVVWAGDHPDCDLRLPMERLDIPYILSRLAFTPSAILLTDDLGRRIIPSGLDRTTILKVYYAVDTPINFYWQKHLSPLFDLVFADQKARASDLAGLSPGAVRWLPVGVDTSIYDGPPESKQFDLGFVGVVNRAVRPKRSRILDVLSRHYRLHTAGGRQGEWVSPAQAARIYRQSRLVLNENLFPGLTTRLLEGMASGSMVMTEDGDGGLEDHFSIGEDLAVYGPDTLIERVDYYLAHDAERERIAARGREKVRSAHDIRHRAQALVDGVAQARSESGLQAGGDFFRELGQTLFLVGLRWPGPDGKQHLLRAETMLMRTLRAGAGDAETRLHLGVISAVKGDRPGARHHYEAAAELGAVEALIGLADVERASGRGHQAVDWCRRAAEAMSLDCGHSIFSPTGFSAELHTLLARIMEIRGRRLTPGFSRLHLPMAMWNALEHYRFALKADPGHVPALVGLADVLQAFGAHTEAHPFLAQAAALRPNDRDLADQADRSARMAYLGEPPTRKVA